MTDRGTTEPIPTCQLCGEPMPEGEEMFNYHGYSGPCPKPQSASLSAPSAPQTESVRELVEALRKIVESANNGNEPGQTWDLVAGGLIDEAERVLARYQK